MSKQEHTPEPWRVCDAPDNDMITSESVHGAHMVFCTTAAWPGSFGSRQLSDQEAEANARRIVACVNACKGTSTEWLEGYGSTLGQPYSLGLPISENFDSIVKQRDDLERQLEQVRGALKAIIDCYGVGYRNPDKCFSDMADFILEARAALTEVKP